MKTIRALRPLVETQRIAWAISESSRPRLGGSLRQKIATVLALPLRVEIGSCGCSGIFAPMEMNAAFDSPVATSESSQEGPRKLLFVAPRYNLRTTQS